MKLSELNKCVTLDKPNGFVYGSQTHQSIRKNGETIGILKINDQGYTVEIDGMNPQHFNTQKDLDTFLKKFDT